MLATKHGVPAVVIAVLLQKMGDGADDGADDSSSKSRIDRAQVGRHANEKVHL